MKARLKNRHFLAAIAVACAAASCLADEPARDPVYANFFAETMKPEMYLRYLGALESANRTTQPNLTGQYALKLTARFSPALRTATLFWDLSPISFNRIRFHVWNPNPNSLPIYLQTRLIDTEKRGYLLPYFSTGFQTGATPTSNKRLPLPTSLSTSRSNPGWICYEARLPQDIRQISSKDQAPPSRGQLRERAFIHLSMSFDVNKNFPAFEKPITLIVDGLELYSDPD